MTDGVETIVAEIAAAGHPRLPHDSVVEHLANIFRYHGFQTEREVWLLVPDKRYKGHRYGYLDLVATRKAEKIVVPVEYDSGDVVRWKSFEKIVHYRQKRTRLTPTAGIAVTAQGSLAVNANRLDNLTRGRAVGRYGRPIPTLTLGQFPIYIVSLKGGFIVIKQRP